MKINRKLLIICLAVPLIVGVVSGLLSMGGMEEFARMNKPAFSPPGWLFPVVWTILYALMGLASYLVIVADKPQEEKALPIKLYGLQLAFNFFWSIIFFNMQRYYFAFAWLVVLWVLIILTTYFFYRVSKPAAYLMIPYLLWVTFAGYLNLGVAILN